MENVEYSLSGGGPLDKFSDIIGPILLRIEARDGSVTTEAVVAEAKTLPDDHPLRRYIWGASNSEAAMRYRLLRAADVIRSVSVILRAPGMAPATTRLMLRGIERGTFSNVERVMSSAEMRDKALGDAAQAAEDFATRYKWLAETAEIVAAIHAAIPRMKKTPAKK